VHNGTATHRTGAKTQVTHQTFTAPATLYDSGRTTDVLLLEIAPIVLTSRGVQIQLAQITLDIDDLPSEDDWLATLLPTSGERAVNSQSAVNGQSKDIAHAALIQRHDVE
jgi:hypothetical protein